MGAKEESRGLVGVAPATVWLYKPDACAAKKAKSKVRQQQPLLKEEAMKTHCQIDVGTASSSEEEEEEESRHLLESGGDPAPGHPVPAADEEAKARQQMRWKEAVRVSRRGYVVMKTAVGTGSGEEEAGHESRRGCNWPSLLLLLPFRRLDPEPIRSVKALRAQRDAFLRPQKMTPSQLRALNNKIVLPCLEWHNSKHPDDEYEPAPGVVTRCTKYRGNLIWTHGNFVARRKRSGCFSFLPAPRTLFFFELRRANGVVQVTACIPIDEPVTEAYTFLGFPLGWGTRRNGQADCVCKTCYRQFHVPHFGLKRTCACEDSKVESVCKMCYLNNNILHPIRGGFVLGQ